MDYYFYFFLFPPFRQTAFENASASRDVLYPNVRHRLGTHSRALSFQRENIPQSPKNRYKRKYDHNKAFHVKIRRFSYKVVIACIRLLIRPIFRESDDLC